MTPKAAELLAEEVKRQYSSSHHVCHDLSMGDGGIMWSPSDPSSEESEEDDTSSDMLNGDDEDDGLFIGAPHEDDDESIAFSDIVLPTDEDHDPFLMELNEQMAAEAAILASEEPPIPAMVVSKGVSPTDAPSTAHYRVQEQKKKPVRAPSVHTIVAHAVAQKRKTLESLSQAELLEQLEKRLRPYMKLPLKLPPLRRRKRPNCMFLNYMGTRRPQAPKKRKLAAADLKASDSVITKKKKEEASPALLAKESEAATKLTTGTTSPKPTTVTAPSSPRRIVEPVLSAPSPPKAPTLLPKLLTDPLWEDDLVQKPETDLLSEKDLVPKPDKPQSLTPVKSLEMPKTSLGLSQGEENETAVAKSAVTTSENTDTLYSTDDESKSSTSIATEKANNTETKKRLTQKELDDAKRSEVFRCMAASMSPNPMAPQATAARVRSMVQKSDPPGDKSKTETVSAPSSPRQKQDAFTSSILPKSPSSGSADQEAEEASQGSIHEPLDPFSEGSFLFEPSHHHCPFYSLDSDDVHEPVCDSPVQVGRHVRALNHEAYIPFEHDDDDDDHFHPSGSSKESDSSEASSSPPLISENMKQQPPPPPSFVTLGPNAISPHRVHHPSPFATRRPMLLSPEMDMLAPGARYAYYSPSQGTMEDHMPPSSPQVMRRRAMPIRMTTHDTADYCISDAHGSNRRSSLPYAPLPTQHWVPTLHSGGATALVTPDAFSSPYHRKKVKHLHMESADTVTSRGYSIPGPPLLQVHPQDGYHSPVSHRRVINDSTLQKGEKSKASDDRGSGSKTKVVKKTPKVQQQSKKQPKKDQKTMKTRSNLAPVKKTKTIS